FKYQIISAFNLSKKNFLNSEMNKDSVTGDITHTAKNISDVGSRKKSILNQWDFNNERANLTKDDLKSILNENGDLFSKFDKNSGNITNEGDLLEYYEDLKNILNQLGIHYTMEAFELYLNDISGEEVSLKSKIKTFRKTLSGVNHGLTAVIDAKDSSVNLIESQSVFSKLAEAEGFLLEEGSDASVFSGSGTKWVYSLPSYIDLK